MRYFENPYVGPDGEVPASAALHSSSDVAKEAMNMVKECFDASKRFVFFTF